MSTDSSSDPVNPPSTRRERQFAERWEQIVSAAAELFAQKGFHRTTTKEIAEAADVSEGTLYNYFESKNDIMFGILARLTEAQSSASRPGASMPLSLNARQFFTAYLDYRKGHFDRNFVMMQALISEILSDAELRERYYQQLLEPSIHAMEAMLRMRVELGQIRQVDPALTSRVLSSLLLGTFLLKAMGDPLIDAQWDQLAELTTGIIFDGLAPNAPTGTRS